MYDCNALRKYVMRAKTDRLVHRAFKSSY